MRDLLLLPAIGAVVLAGVIVFKACAPHTPERPPATYIVTCPNMDPYRATWVWAHEGMLDTVDSDGKRRLVSGTCAAVQE